ncbi:hypothetical protein RRG08_025840 [Elysia crispata]|uniref:Uncharacterized protein n=1 Tax=Elysia crispata TaxID=231223 RepID=A0AAE0Y3A0_9GAST|nr:hypothetical protein RRG08_025840 [Elysia crispata]
MKTVLPDGVRLGVKATGQRLPQHRPPPSIKTWGKPTVTQRQATPVTWDESAWSVVLILVVDAALTFKVFTRSSEDSNPKPITSTKIVVSNRVSSPAVLRYHPNRISDSEPNLGQS